ncbi:MAG TPA: hypothetical protein VGD64_09465 [Acidisarcina sp.]
MANHRSSFGSGLGWRSGLSLVRPIGLIAIALAVTASAPGQSSAGGAPVGTFSGHGDVGTVLHSGSAAFDSATGVFTLTGSGENVWGTSDALQFVWKKLDGPDAALSAAISFVGTGGNAHRKAMLMMRQSLDADSPYVDIARHGDGLISLQYRDEKGGVTREVETGLSSPAALRLVKRGDFFYLFSEEAGGGWKFSGAAMKLPMQSGYYLGIGVCAHDKDAVEKATFSKVELSAAGPATAATSAGGVLASTLETVAIASTDRRVVYTEAGHFEAPNWLRDESGLLINENGRLERVEAAAVGGEPGRGTVMTWNGKPPVVLDSLPEMKLNNDHGLSPDGKWIAFSDSTEPGGSRVYVMPASGGKPVKITADAPSYFHGWSPDGKTLAFVGERKGEFDIYTVPATGGEPTQLTKAAGFNDGPDYSADGVWIYFNSTRSGHMQIWRMHTDGTGAEQVTHDATEDWFAHPSPDGKSIVFLAYPAGTPGHPGSLDVTLRVIAAAGGEAHLLAKLWGGQGTINVPSWSPDSSKVAFVSYAMLPVDAEK